MSTDGRSAPQRILDVASALIAERGIDAVSMTEVAAAAQVSRATLYRYYSDRAALDAAIVRHEAVRIGTEAIVAAQRYPERDRTVEGVLDVVRMVRTTPALAAWFTPGRAAESARLAGDREVVAAACADLVDDPEDARWVVRQVLSLLCQPGADDADERRQLRRYLAPMVGPLMRDVRSGA